MPSSWGPATAAPSRHPVWLGRGARTARACRCVCWSAALNCSMGDYVTGRGPRGGRALPEGAANRRTDTRSSLGALAARCGGRHAASPCGPQPDTGRWAFISRRHSRRRESDARAPCPSPPWPGGGALLAWPAHHGDVRCGGRRHLPQTCPLLLTRLVGRASGPEGCPSGLAMHERSRRDAAWRGRAASWRPRTSPSVCGGDIGVQPPAPRRGGGPREDLPT